MTNPNVQLASLDFQGHPIRVLEQAEILSVPPMRRVRLTPLNDIADALGRHRDPIRRLVDRDPVLSEMATTTVTVAVDGKDRETRCLSYEGVLLLITKLNASRSATKEAREFLIAFQRWVAEVLKAAMLGEPHAPKKSGVRVSLTSALTKDLIRVFGLEGAREALVRIHPEYFAGLPGVKPSNPQPALQPNLGMVEPATFRLRLEADHA